MTARIIYGGLLEGADALITPGSEEAALPRAALLRHHPSDVLRFQYGWDIREDENDRIDFNRGGVKVAQITAGHYATGTALAAAINAAFEAADATPVWDVTHVGIGSFFSLESDLAFSLLFGTGNNMRRSIARDIGFPDADEASSTTHFTSTAVYQSRRVIFVDQGAGAAGPGLVVDATNNKLDFDRGGAKVATVASATYTSPTTLAAAIVTALEAADAAPAWDCTYLDGVFTLDSDMSFSLLFATGANLATSIHPDLGFEDLDTTAGFNPFFSHSIAQAFEITAPFKGVAIRGHNVSAAGTVRVDGFSVTMVGGGDLGFSWVNHWGMQAPEGAYSATLAAGAEGDLRIAFATAPQFRRFLRLVIDDVENPAGYNELGIWMPGPVLDVIEFALRVVDAREELSELLFAIGGAHVVVDRGTRLVWEITVHNVEASAKAEWQAFAAAVKNGKPFFFNFDDDDPTDTRYVFLDGGLVFESQESDPVTWTLTLRLREALG